MWFLLNQIVKYLTNLNTENINRIDGVCIAQKKDDA